MSVIIYGKQIRLNSFSTDKTPTLSVVSRNKIIVYHRWLSETGRQTWRSGMKRFLKMMIWEGQFGGSSRMDRSNEIPPCEAFLSSFIVSTPEDMAENVTETDIRNGFVPRFDIIFTTNIPDHDLEPKKDEDYYRRRARLRSGLLQLNGLYELKEDKPRFEICEDALPNKNALVRWQNWQKTIHEKYRKNRDLIGFVRKYEKKALKLAQVYSVSRTWDGNYFVNPAGDDEPWVFEVSFEDMGNAIGWMNERLKDAKAFVDYTHTHIPQNRGRTASEREKVWYKVQKVTQDKKEFTERDIYRNLSVDNDRTKAFLVRFFEEGRLVEAGKTDKGGAVYALAE